MPLRADEWEEFSPGFGDNSHRGHFGEQFIRMLAAAANIDAAQRDRDRVGVDWQLGHPRRSGGRRYPVIEAQVKCTSSPELHDDHIAFDLKTRYYNELAGNDYDIPRFLFVVLAPADPFSWSDATPERLLLRNAAYWACLHDQKPVAGGTGTRRVHVPRGNLLTADTLHDLFSPNFRAMVGVS
ncbi:MULTISPECIES: DUF4365 domain-containing protein [Streptomyces]|uniref:DUF4365 domain-containing protein n=1 Tax=Streptomyces TaxID=1883 RepID=UPI00068F9354|nr:MULTISPECIES: DUF4365 domain-containing protein [Streptomyces]